MPAFPCGIPRRFLGNDLLLRSSCAARELPRASLKIIAFEVDHKDAIKPACGYRIEYGGRLVVISGNIRDSANIVNGN